MMQLEGSLSIAEACELARVSRAGFYRAFTDHAPGQAQTELHDQIQRVALANRCYGYRRVTAELRRQGIVVNHKCVLRILRQDNLLSLRRRRFVLTTESRHGFVRYPNLAGRMAPTAINQLWVADITYIRLREEFIYLAVVLDAYSRRRVPSGRGWELDETLQASLALKALDRALADRAIQPGIVHHSDQGVRYCCPDYVGRLLDHGFVISMSRAGTPYDNAKAESFIKTLKAEEVQLKQYRDIEEARQQIRHFLEEVYNRKRLHSALGYRAPAEFEAAAATAAGGSQ
ncbi:MAG: IS3 family transposase [Bryobacteraceae bacterium]|jgi:transposase InsO family protein